MYPSSVLPFMSDTQFMSRIKTHENKRQGVASATDTPERQVLLSRATGVLLVTGSNDSPCNFSLACVSVNANICGWTCHRFHPQSAEAPIVCRGAVARRNISGDRVTVHDSVKYISQCPRPRTWRISCL